MKEDRKGGRKGREIERRDEEEAEEVMEIRRKNTMNTKGNKRNQRNQFYHKKTVLFILYNPSFIGDRDEECRDETRLRNFRGRQLCKLRNFFCCFLRELCHDR